MRHLRYFEALSRHNHFGKAAEACSISQPALSVQIKELEELVGASLIERHTRHVSFTALGENFALRCRDILHAVDELGDLARASLSQFGGRLRIGVIPTVAPYLLPRIMGAIATHLPGLDLHPREATTRTLIEALQGGRLDAALVALPILETEFHQHPLFEEEFVLVRHERDAENPVPTPEILQKMRFLLLEEGHCFRDQALSFCHLASQTPRDLVECSSLTTLVQMVGAGIGVTLIPQMAVEIETRAAPVAVSRLQNPTPTRTLGMVWRKSSPLAAQLVAFAEHVKAARCKDMDIV